MQKAFESIILKFIKDEINPLSEVDLESESGEEYFKAISESLEENGFIAEIQAFIRQRLVIIIKGNYPNLVNTFRGKLSPSILKLISDFLCSHKLLFTFSVLATELNGKYKFSSNLNKIAAYDAETLLDNLQIRKDSSLNRKILKNYSDLENVSLLELILINNNEWRKDLSNEEEDLPKDKSNYLLAVENLNEKFNDLSRHSEKEENSSNNSLIHEKESIKKLQYEKLKSKEIELIRDEIETRCKYELIKKEKELIELYEEKVKFLQNNYKDEKRIWLEERVRKEKELNEKKEDLIKLQQKINELEELSLSKDYNENSNGMMYNCSSPTKINTNFNGGRGGDDNFSYEKMIRRERDRQLLLKEAEMRKTIEKLTKENLLLRSTQLPPEIPYENQGTKNEYCERDKLAMLQYTIESQSLELKELRDKVNKNENRNNNYRMPIAVNREYSSINNGSKSSHSDNELERFLYESKRRCQEIEKEAEKVEISFKNFRKNDSFFISSSSMPRIPSTSFEENSSNSRRINNNNNYDYEMSPVTTIIMESNNNNNNQKSQQKLKKQFEKYRTNTNTNYNESLIYQKLENKFTELLKGPVMDKEKEKSIFSTGPNLITKSKLENGIIAQSNSKPIRDTNIISKAKAISKVHKETIFSDDDDDDENSYLSNKSANLDLSQHSQQQTLKANRSGALIRDKIPFNSNIKNTITATTKPNRVNNSNNNNTNRTAVVAEKVFIEAAIHNKREENIKIEKAKDLQQQIELEKKVASNIINQKKNENFIEERFEIEEPKPKLSKDTVEKNDLLFLLKNDKTLSSSSSNTSKVEEFSIDNEEEGGGGGEDESVKGDISAPEIDEGNMNDFWDI